MYNLLVIFLSRLQHVKLFYVPFLKASPFHNFSLLLKSHIIIIQNSINDKHIYSLFIALVWCSPMMDSFWFEDMTLSMDHYSLNTITSLALNMIS